MKPRIFILAMGSMIGLVITGCANNRELIAKASLATRNDIFAELTDTNVQPDKAVADIKFAVKSNSSYFMGTYNKHSNPPYRVNVNIDGQVVTLESEPVLEDKSPIDSSVPESGTGWKYQFNKRLSLALGTHHIIIALPADDVLVEREIALRAGVNSIIISPVYKRTSLRPFKGQNFKAGVRTVEVAVE